MEPAERLAAYLAGELDADEHAALEAELARDPALRAQLTALRRADAALDTVASAEPPPGFEDRLRAAVDTELERQLGAGPKPVDVTEFTARRRRRARVPALVGVAAAAAVLVAVAIGTDLVPRPPADDDEAVTTMLDSPDTAEDAPAEAPADDAGMGGPTIVAGERELDDAEVEAMLDRPELREMAARRLDSPTGDRLAQEWRDLLRAPVEAAEAAPEAEADADAAPPRVLADQPLDPGEVADVDRCLDALVVEGEPAIPAYVELATQDGADVLVYGMVSRDPGTAAFTRPEIWVVDRSDCQVLRFLQD